jgi:DNA-binding transcriptional LysR family regulator
MARTLPPLAWFRAFECAARHLSFTRAAQELNVTQSAVSQHVRALETKLGAKLFNRKARGLAMTEQGRQLLPHVTGAIGGLARACEIFGTDDAAATLEISCATGFAVRWLIPRIAKFRRQHPALQIRFSSTLWPDDHMRAIADVEIRFGSAELVGVDASALYDDTMVPVCAPALGAAITGPQDLWDLPIIQTAGTADTWQAWAGAADVPPPPPPASVVDSVILATEMARAGEGVALAGRLLCGDLIADGALAVPLDIEVPAVDGYHMAIPAVSGNKAMATAFGAWLRAEIVEMTGRT